MRNRLEIVLPSLIPYWYEGYCPQSGKLLRLPRTPLAEAIALGLMQNLSQDAVYGSEGKMYGVLLVETPSGEQQVLKAFSGLLKGNSVVEGWVPPIPGREQVALEEARTLAKLEAIKQKLLKLFPIQPQKQYETLSQEWKTRLDNLAIAHRQRKQERQQQRQRLLNTLTGDALAIALEHLNEESRRDGRERKQLKREQDEVLQPLKQAIATVQTEIHSLKQQRKELSRHLQAQMHAAYSLTNFAGKSYSLQDLMPFGLPTGTGDCCAPKLLHYAAIHHLKPLAMAEFWWGKPHEDKEQGEFYGACPQRCQPLMGFLLSGLSALGERQVDTEFSRSEAVSIRNFSSPTDESGFFPYTPHPYPPTPLSPHTLLPVIYEDQWLIAVNKPSGLLSVPGRYRDRQDSVLSRLRHLLPDGMNIIAVHRLDQDTSGILLLARDHSTYRHLSRQFQQRQIYKVYEAILGDVLLRDRGVIELSLWGDPSDRPYQKVDFQQGKPSITHFQVIDTDKPYTRLEFIPLTGRTHQLRVHAAHPQGLGIAILGDRLYGCGTDESRLHLHARELRFLHPQSEKTVHLQVETPF